MATTTPTPKSGFKSSEFWTSVPGAAALIQTAQELENVWIQGIAVTGATLCVLWYTYQRTQLKAGK